MTFTTDFFLDFSSFGKVMKKTEWSEDLKAAQGSSKYPLILRDTLSFSLVRHYIYCLYFCSRRLSIALLKSPRTGSEWMSLGVLPPFRSSGQRSSTGIFPHGAWGGMGTVGRKWRDCEDCDSHRRKEPVMSHQQAQKEILSPTTAVLSERRTYHSCKNQVFQRLWSISSSSNGYKRQPSSVRPFVHIVL